MNLADITLSSHSKAKRGGALLLTQFLEKFIIFLFEFIIFLFERTSACSGSGCKCPLQMPHALHQGSPRQVGFLQ